MSEPNISPLAKRLAEENNVDWRRLLGSGPDGRVVERDVLEYLARVMSGEESIDPTPEPLPSGMDAWPEDDIRGFHPQPQSARPGPQHKDELDLSGFDDEVALEPAFDTRPDERHGKGAAATGGDFYSTQTSLPAYEDPSAALEDDEDLLEIDDEPGSQDAAEAEAPAAAGSFGSDAEEDEPVIGADLFLFDEESDDEEDLPLFDVDEPAGDDADAPIFSADASDPWETDPTSEPGSSDSGTPAALPQDDPWPTGSDDEPVFGAQVDAAGQTRDDDIVPAEDGFGADDSEEEEEDELDLSAFDLELESGHEAAPEELDDSQPEPAAEFTDETTGFAGDESFSDPADFDPFAPDEPENLAPLPTPFAAEEELGSGREDSATDTDDVGLPKEIQLVSYGTLLRRHLDLTALSQAQVAVGRERAEGRPVAPGAFLLRAAAKALAQAPLAGTGPVALAVFSQNGLGACVVDDAAGCGFRALLDEVEAASRTAAGSLENAALVVADMSGYEIDEAVLRAQVPVLTLGRVLYDSTEGRYRSTLSLSGEVPAEQGSRFLAAVAELLDTPVRLVI